jgi:hypothetical protein
VNGPVVDLLRAAARVQWEADDAERLAVAARSVVTWDGVPDAAEAHGLAPLLYRRLSDAGVPISIDARQQLFAASVRHRDANQHRLEVLGQILDAFDRERIRVVVLKGAALANILYEAPGLRPFGDLDLLVEPQDAWRAQTILGSIGFAAPPVPTERRLLSHHHLPLAVRQSGGHIVQVELHTNALSLDSSGSLTMADLSHPVRTFDVAGRSAATLGHIDMLYQLCRHIAERASLLRLIWVADIVGYAARYVSEIPWEELRRRHPFVINALSLLHLVTPLSEPVLTQVEPADGSNVAGVGEACRPLAETLRRDRRVRAIAHDLFSPPEWWLRLHYGVAADQSLLWQRRVVHPGRVAYWIARRAMAYARWEIRRSSARL